MLIHSARQLLTLAGGPQRGQALGNLGIIEDGALLIQGEQIVDIGTSADLLAKYPTEPRLDARGKVVMPGFVDPHTHLVFAGDRAVEFEMRLQGKTYLEILQAGGGILSTVRATRSASVETLVAFAAERAEVMLRHGTTTAEAKTGYGLEWQSELRQMEALIRLDTLGGLEIHPTFLAAHAIPEEYRDSPNAYVEQICRDMLPELRRWWIHHADARPLPFVDVFCERGAFSLSQSRQILESARALGFPLKIHADEFENLGAAGMAMELGAVSVDHLVKTSPEEIERLGTSPTVAVSLPCTPFGLAEPEYTPARAILAANGIPNVYFLAGDIHSAHAVHADLYGPNGRDLRIWEFCSSPFEQQTNPATWTYIPVFSGAIKRQKMHWVLPQYNYGVVRVTYDASAQAHVCFEVYGENGDLLKTIQAA